nr:LOG family protein [Paludibacterium denitrificans]
MGWLRGAAGGFGTFDELFEILTWAQLGIHGKPIGLLNVAGFYDPLMQMVKQTIEAGFVREQNLSLFTLAETPTALLDSMRNHRPRHIAKWLDLERT